MKKICQIIKLCFNRVAEENYVYEGCCTLRPLDIDEGGLKRPKGVAEHADFHFIIRNWAKSITTAVYIMNRTPTAIVHGMTPKENFIGKKLDVSHLGVFGCIAYVHVPNEKRSKLDPKVEKCIFIGYSLEQKAYRCFNPSTRKLQVNRDVMFDEMVSQYSPLKIGANGEARNGDVSSNVEQES